MDISLILLIIGFIVAVVLILKFVKKIIAAIFSIVFLFILIIGSIGFLTYLDINNLANQKDFKVNLIYGASENPEFGVILSVENGSLSKNIKSLEISNLKNINFEDIEKDSDFYIFTPESFYKKILKDNEKYYLEGTKDYEYSGFTFETGLTKSEVFEIFNSNDPVEKYIDIILNKNSIPSFLQDTAKGLIKGEFENLLKEKDLDLKSALLVSILYDKSKNSNQYQSILTNFVLDYKEGNIEIYPDRMTFWMIRQVPLSFIEDKINEFTNNN
jgi:hypothetical protein